MRLNLISSNSPNFDDELITYNKNISAKLLEIYEPLSKDFNTNLFEYYRFFDDYSFFYISTNTEWHEHYIKNYARSTLAIEHIKRVFDENIKYYILNSNTTIHKEGETSLFIKCMNIHNIYNYFTIYTHYNDSIEAFSFATSIRNSSFINTYLNNIDILYRFIMYFRNKAPEIINDSNHFENFSSKKGFLIKNNPVLSKQDRKVENFLKSTEINRYPVMIENEIKYLTPRQAQCVYYLAKGRTYKQIGRLLNIGPKCVENHLSTVRLKIGCMDNSCIINVFEQNRVLNKMLFFIGGK